MHVCLIPKQDKKDVLKLNRMLTSLLQSPRHMPQFELVNAPALLQCHNARCKGVAVRCRRDQDTEQHLSRAEAAFFFFFFSDIYTCNAAETVRVADPDYQIIQITGLT